MKFISRFIAAVALLCSAALAAAATPGSGSMVRLQTNMGWIDIALLDADTPITVANFLAYVRAGDYDNVFFHRDAWTAVQPPVPFVIQAGGYRWADGTSCCTTVTSRGAIQNEFSPARSNIRGTVAMAKVGGNPNSATSQWFINMNNNAANLDNQNGGFTVFGRVTGPGMYYAEQISNLPRYVVQNTPFTEIPLTQPAFNTGTIVRITRAAEIPDAAANDKIFNYLEAAYSQFVDAFPASAGDALGFNYRFYAAANSYLGVKDGHVWFYAPALLSDVLDIGTVDFWLSQATSNGY